MNILILTNTYLPHVGGVARSVAAFEAEYRRRGHQVLVVAPEFDSEGEDPPHVVRIPAIHNFNGSDFSFPVPFPTLLTNALDDFQPDIVHSHHPFLLGSAAIRIARSRKVPLVFTQHTMYEHYTHYVNGEQPWVARFITALSVGYANLCDATIAPSESVADVLRERGVTSPIHVIPTGIDTAAFARGDGRGFRDRHCIPHNGFVVGHVGRLAPEKNLPFLATAVSRFLARCPNAHFLVVGAGPSELAIRESCQSPRLAERLHMVGKLCGQELIDAYHAMDLFAFASQSETQGLVLVEAMATGLPVVAIDASGVREVVEDFHNGRLLADEDCDAFADALQWVATRSESEYADLHRAACETAEKFSMPRTGEQALSLYRSLISAGTLSREEAPHRWAAARVLEAEWDLLSVAAKAAGSALQS